jgi:ketosteroid isomerase-like protein
MEPLGTRRATPISPIWAAETTLDVEWAHRMAPGVAIVLMTSSDNRVAIEAESYGIARSGKLHNNLYHLLVLLDNGKIKTVREYLDSGHAREVLGRISG